MYKIEERTFPGQQKDRRTALGTLRANRRLEREMARKENEKECGDTGRAVGRSSIALTR